MDQSNIINLGLLLITAIGVIVAVLQAKFAKDARDDAQTARDKAQEYEQRALTASEVSASAAQRSASALEAAQQVDTSRDERETERSDVAWDWRWDPDLKDHVIVQNIGKGLAKDVIAQFFFDTSVEANDYPIDIEGRDHIKLLIPPLADRREFAAESARPPFGWALAQRAGAGLPTPAGSTARIRLRVTWVTPKGTPKLHDTDYSVVPLPSNPH